MVRRVCTQDVNKGCKKCLGQLREIRITVFPKIYVKLQRLSCMLEDVTKNKFVQSPVTLVINIQSQNEYICTQGVFRYFYSKCYLLHL